MEGFFYMQELQILNLANLTQLHGKVRLSPLVVNVTTINLQNSGEYSRLILNVTIVV